MIPHLVTVHHRRSNGRGLRLYVPVRPVLLVLSPLLLLIVLVGLVACFVFRVSPVDAWYGTGQLLSALRGTEIEIEQGRTAVFVTVT
jgi:hypothetical protein